MAWHTEAVLSFPKQKSQEMPVGEATAVPLPNDYKIERRNDVEPLVTAPDAGHQIARRVGAETGVVPVLARPFWLQHLLKVEFSSVRGRAVVPPA